MNLDGSSKRVGRLGLVSGQREHCNVQGIFCTGLQAVWAAALQCALEVKVCNTRMRPHTATLLHDLLHHGLLKQFVSHESNDRQCRGVRHGPAFGDFSIPPPQHATRPHLHPTLIN